MEHLRSGFVDQMLQHCIAGMTADTTHEMGSRVRQKYQTGSSAESQLLSHLPWHYQPFFGLQNFAIQPQHHQQKLPNEVADQVQKYRTGSSADLQLLSHLPWHQYQPIFGFQNFAIQLQQHRLLNVVANQIYAQIARSLAQKTENMRMPSEINKTKIGSNSPLLFASSEEVYPHNRHDRSPQSNEKSTMIMQSDDNIADDAKQVREVRKQYRSSIQTNRVDKTEGSLQEKENQVNSSVLMKKGNLGDEKDSVALRKMFRCVECGKGFQRKDYLVQHMRIHTGEKPFDCHICNKSFRQKQALNAHLLRHSGVKPFRCHNCNKSFGQKTTLNNHLLCHSGERPFACNICQRSFSRKDVLTRHMHTHSGQKLHNCDVCQKSFLQNSALSSHQKQCHTKDKVE